MKLFKDNIHNDCLNKCNSIDRELEFFYEREFLQKDIGDIINEWFEIYKYKDLPTIDFENFYLCEEPIVGRDTTSLKIYIPLIGEYDSLQYEPYRQSL